MPKEANNLSYILPQELEELKSLTQWVAYRLIWDDRRGKASKIPIDPKTGNKAKANDPTTWATYSEAFNYALADAQRKGVQIGQAGGVGFEFGSEGGIMGIDLDNVILKDGSLKPWAAEIVEILSSYTEYSPSERGLHIFCKIDKPLSTIGSNRRNDDIGLEMYDTGRFFTVTGKIYGEPRAIETRSDEVKQIYERFLNKKDNQKSIVKPLQSTVTNSHYETDSDLLNKMFKSQNGNKISALYNGDISGYSDDWSRADMALVSHLAYWTNGDAQRMDTLFRQSKLMRPKWDERHGAQTYGQMTIDKVLSNFKQYISTRNPNYSQFILEPDYDNFFMPDMSQYGKEPIAVHSITQYLDESLNADLVRFQKYSGLKTGFSNIDEKMSLFPGLYIIGGVSSLGKTTFAHQMADQLTRAGEHVLFFTVEQSEFELISKGLARLTAQESFNTALSSVEIRSGRITDALRRAIAEYKSFAEHEMIVELGFEASFNDISTIVRNYITSTGERPIVFLDYIQLLRPLNSNLSAKDAADYAVRAFKQLQMEFDLVIVLLSSLNRQNYLTPIDFEAFKESGSIEFTADVIWGLQLQIMNDPIFDSSQKLMAKRDAVKTAKRANPRKIELVCLKNRFGIANSTYKFNYYAKYDLFIPVDTSFDDFSDDFSSKTSNRRVI